MNSAGFHHGHPVEGTCSRLTEEKIRYALDQFDTLIQDKIADGSWESGYLPTKFSYFANHATREDKDLSFELEDILKVMTKHQLTAAAVMYSDYIAELAEDEASRMDAPVTLRQFIEDNKADILAAKI